MSQATRAGGAGGGDELAMLAIIGAGVTPVATWAGAQAAALVHAGRTMLASPADGLRALVRIPANASEPRVSWEPAVAELLPGPVLYWTTTSVVVLVALGIVVGMYVRFGSTRVGTDRKDRLGATPEARLARRRDLKPLIVKRSRDELTGHVLPVTRRIRSLGTLGHESARNGSGIDTYRVPIRDLLVDLSVAGPQDLQMCLTFFRWEFRPLAC